MCLEFHLICKLILDFTIIHFLYISLLFSVSLEEEEPETILLERKTDDKWAEKSESRRKFSLRV